MNTVYIALGSNLGDRESFLNHAIDSLSAHPFIEVSDVSDFIETTAVSDFAQPDFLNGALRLTTLLSPEELLEETQRIEVMHNRTEKGTKGPRTIDIDILLYNDLIVSTDTLVIPHPLLHERMFVLQPLAQIAPLVLHPVFNDTILTLYSQLSGY